MVKREEGGEGEMKLKEKAGERGGERGRKVGGREEDEDGEGTEGGKKRRVGERRGT